MAAVEANKGHEHQRRSTSSSSTDQHLHPAPALAPAPAVTTVFADGDVPDHLGGMTEDEAALAVLGYRQEFKREFSAWSTFAVSFAVMGLLPSIASTMWYGIGYGTILLLFLLLGSGLVFLYIYIYRS